MNWPRAFAYAVQSICLTILLLALLYACSGAAEAGSSWT